MNGIENAPNAPVAVKAPQILARKSLIGKWKQTGAPPKEIVGLTKNPSRATFTKHDIFERNGRTVSLLTIDKRIKQYVKARKLVKLAEAMKTDGPGRPSFRYSFDLSKAAPKRTRKAKAVVAETPDAPVVPVTEMAAPIVNDAPAAPMDVTPAPVGETAFQA